MQRRKRRRRALRRSVVLGLFGLGALCGLPITLPAFQAAECASPPHATLTGHVEDAGSALPLPEAPVSASWDGGTAETVTDATGGYHLCVAAGLEVTLVASFLGKRGDPVTIRLEPGGTAEQVLEIDLGGGGARVAAREWPGPAGAATRVVGRVVDRQTGRAVEGAVVTLAETDLQALSDGQGRFLLREVPPGAHELRFRHIAYGDVGEAVEVPAAHTLEVEARLVPRAIELEPIVVTAVRDRTLELRGFYERKEWGEKLGLGVYMTWEDFQGRDYGRASDLLRGIPSLRLLRFCEGPGSCFHVPGPVSGASQLGRVIIVGTKTIPLAVGSRLPCPADVFLDGINLRLFRLGGGSLHIKGGIDEFVYPGELVGIEVYRRASELPAEFGGATEGCGAVVFWTARGPRGR